MATADEDSPQQQRTRVRVAKARELMSAGYSTTDVVGRLSELYQVSRGSARRSIRHALRMEAAEADHARRIRVGQQLSKLRRAQRMALESERTVVTQEGVLRVPDPDTRAFLQAVKQESALLGLELVTPAQLEEGGGACVGQLVLVQRTQAESESSTGSATPTAGNGTSNGHSPREALPSPFTRRNGHS